MKKILTFCFFLLFATNIQAQDFSNLRLGIQVSPTFSWMSTNSNQITSSGTKLGLNLGFTGEYFFTENYSLVSGVSLLVNQGGGLEYSYAGNFLENTAAEDRPTSAIDISNIPAESKISYSNQYIEIPVSIRLRTNEFGYFRYFAEMPVFSLGFRTQSRADISGTLTSDNENIAGDMNPVSFKWGLGGGVEYSVSQSLSLVGGIYYNSTLIDVIKDSTDDDSKATINSLTIKIAALF